MARTSKKAEVLEAAYRLIDEEGIEAVTYDRLAEVTGLSKSGLIYHFPSRHEMLIAIHQDGADHWEAEIVANLPAGSDPATLTAEDRLRAALSTLTEPGPLAEMSLQLHARTHEDYAAPWREVEKRWLADPASPDTPLPALSATLLAAGLWAHNHVFQRNLAAEHRAVIMEQVFAMLAADTPGSSED